MKTSFMLPILALVARVLADTPPACLLNAVNTQDSPTDLASLCGKEATDVQKAIASLCNNNAVSAAQSAFIATCSGAGSSVAPYTVTANSTTTKGSSTATSAGTFVYTTAVYNSDCSCTTTIVTSATTGAAVNTGLATATGSSGGASASGSSGSGASASGNAAADTKQVGSFAAAVIAIAGVVAVL